MKSFALLLALGVVSSVVYAQPLCGSAAYHEKLGADDDNVKSSAELPDDDGGFPFLTQFMFLIMGALVFFMQAGFAMLEAGSVGESSVTSILFKNVLDVFLGAVAYFLFGYAISYGLPVRDASKDPEKSTRGGFMGIRGGLWALEEVDLCTYSDFFYQWTFAATTATIVSGAMAGRTKVSGYFVYSMFLTGFIYPVVVHWTWSGDAWLANEGYSDFAGSGIVHVTGGIAALMGAIMVGPRKIFIESADKDDIAGHSMPLVALGTFILIFGFFGFNGGSVLSLGNEFDTALISLAIVNTVMAAAGGGATAGIIYKIRAKKYGLSIICNGGIAGMVAICAGADSMYPWAAWITGAFGGMAFFGVSRLLNRLRIDDAIDAVGVHAGAGLAGLICKPFFAFNGGIFYGNKEKVGGYMLGWNIAGVLLIIIWTVFSTGILFLALKKMGMLRVDDGVLNSDFENKESIDMHEHGEAAYDIPAGSGSPKKVPKANAVGPAP